MSSDGDLDPLRLLEEDLKDDDYEQAIASVKRLTTIALALGPERARTDLMTYLMTYCGQDNDEAHTAVAQQLGLMAELVGGPPHVPCLLPVLEKLAGEEECVVRDAAVNSLNKLSPVLSKAQTKDTFVPLIKRLASGDWFTMRVSACGLFTDCYANCDAAMQEELRSIFRTLTNDDTPMVRKAAYKNLGRFSSAVVRPSQARFKTDVFPILEKISEDDVDSMRLHAIGVCCELADSLSTAEYGESVMPVLEALQDDASWKVRKGLAEAMPELCRKLCKEDSLGNKIMPIFARLLKDKEAEVRAASAKSLAPVCACAKNVEVHLAPVLGGLATDQSQNVRSELSKALGDLFDVFNKDVAQKTLMPILQQLKDDEAFEVRNNIVNDLDKVTTCLGPTAITTAILPILIDLSKDQKWRVRMAVVEKAAYIAQHLDPAKFEKKMLKIVIDCLSDHVYSIREKCCEQIGKIVEKFSGEWAKEHLFSQEKAFKIYNKTTNYLHRMTCLHIIIQCASVSGSAVVNDSLLPYVIEAASDEVPNVRLAAAKAMIKVIPELKAEVVTAKLVPLLKDLMADTDSDVSYFSREAQKEVTKLGA